MVYRLDYIGEPKQYLIISDLLPSAILGVLLILCSLIPLIWYWYRKEKVGLNDLNRWTLVIASFVYVGIYICSNMYIDELFINLEHSWNLFHHGLFSFSPNRMIDGTVEIFYYFLLTPFALGREALIRANYLFGLFIGWLHLLLLWRLLSDKNFDLKLFLLILFSINYPLIRIFSNGFGNGLVSLLFFLSIYWQIKGSVNKALLMASTLPLLRPDAVLYSLSVFFVDYVNERKWRLFPIGLLIVSILAYFSLVKIMYGHWVPTPMHFKSFVPCMINLIIIDDLYNFMLYFIGPFHLFFLFVFAISFHLKNDEVNKLSPYFLPLFAIFTFYTFTSFNPIYDGRYYVGFELFQAVFPILYFDRQHLDVKIVDLKNKLSLDTHQIFNKRLLLLFFPILIIFVIVFTLQMRFITPYLYQNRVSVDNYSVGGQILDEILPSEWAVATTELNTFGFMNNRDVIDLWGYTNPEISYSKIFSTAWRIRVNTEFFLKMKPEVYWHRTERSNAMFDKGEIDDIENVLFSNSNINRFLSHLGDMRHVFALYDVIVLGTGEWVNQFFIRKDLSEQFLQILRRKGYIIEKSREIDHKKVERLYNVQKNYLFICGA